uniref:Uncharacterized protein n=1 Tax=Anguilla anguilla TaxID=7936 RepID=A0A0E9WN17_ANGAN
MTATRPIRHTSLDMKLNHQKMKKNPGLIAVISINWHHPMNC